MTPDEELMVIFGALHVVALAQVGIGPAFRDLRGQELVDPGAQAVEPPVHRRSAQAGDDEPDGAR